MRQWRESKSGDFPRKLAGLVKELEAEAANIVKRFEDGERQVEVERQRREEERRAQAQEEAERRRIKAIKDNREELSEIIKAWAKAKRIEDFFADVERRADDMEEDQKAAFWNDWNWRVKWSIEPMPYNGLFRGRHLRSDSGNFKLPPMT